MKKILFIATILISSLTFAQRIQEGELELNGGIALTDNWGVPLYAGVDYGFMEDITIGGQLGFASQSGSVGNEKWKTSWFRLGVNGNYHFNTLLDLDDTVDVYGGASLSYNNFSSNSTKAKSNDSGIGFDIQIGGRYFFNDNIGVNLQLSTGDIITGAQLGVTYKL